MATIDQTKQYNIQASSRNSSYLLADSNTNLILTTTQSSALAFSITTSTHDATKWNLCTRYYTSSSNSFCLDQYGNNATQAVLGAAGWYSGQEWTLIRTTTSDGSTAYRMQSDFAGPDRYLAVVGGAAYMIANATVTDTYWKFVAAAVTASTTSTSSSVVSSSSSSSTSTSTTSSSSSTSPSKSSRPNDFSTGAIAGVAIGAAVIIIGIIAFIVYYRRSSAKYKQTAAAAHAPMPPMKAMGYQPSDVPARKPVAGTYVSEVPAYERVELGPGAAPRYEVDGLGRVHELEGRRMGYDS